MRLFCMLFLIVFLAKYLFFNWSYFTAVFEFIKIFFFVFKNKVYNFFWILQRGRVKDSFPMDKVFNSIKDAMELDSFRLKY